MSNTQINISANGKVTLATAGKYCDRNIDINVSVDSGGGGNSGGLIFTLLDNSTVAAADVTEVKIQFGEVGKITDSSGLTLWEKVVATYIWKKYRVDTVYNWDKYSVMTTYTTYEAYLPTCDDTPEGLKGYIDADFDGDEDDWFDDEPDYDYALNTPPSTSYATYYKTINISTSGEITGGTTSTSTSNVYVYVKKTYTSGDVIPVGWYYLVGNCSGDYILYELIAQASDPEYVKGSKVGSVTSTTSNTYPTDGIQGEYWYVAEAPTITKTLDGEVTSTNPEAYPLDGLHSDGYWYIKQ